MSISSAAVARTAASLRQQQPANAVVEQLDNLIGRADEMLRAAKTKVFTLLLFFEILLFIYNLSLI